MAERGQGVARPCLSLVFDPLQKTILAAPGSAFCSREQISASSRAFF